MFQKLGSLYTLIGTLLLTTLIFIFVILILIDLFIPAPNYLPATQTKQTRYIGKIYSPGFNHEAYYLISREAIDIIGQNYDEYAFSGHWQVNPWTSLTNRKFESQYLNINPDGTRATSDPDNNYADKPTFLVWAFGGSTMFGWGLSDEFTLPSQLQRKLQEKLLNYQVKVVNFGTPSFTTSQELAIFIANLREQTTSPDAVIFLDGLNDVTHIIGKGTNAVLQSEVKLAWNSWIKELINPPTESWFSINPTFPLFKLIQPNIPIRETITFNDGSLSDPLPSRLEESIHQYLFNIDIIDKITKSHDIDTYFLLQPLNKKVSDQTAFVEFYEEISKLTTSESFYDISDTLDNLPTEYNNYVDGSHYSDIGIQAIADRILSIMMSND